MKQQKRNFFQKIFSLFLLVVISLYILPKELIHEFHHHDESIDVICMDTSVVHLSKMHRHCEVLQLNTPPLYFQVGNFSVLTTELFYHLSVEAVSRYQFTASPCLFFRGPPSIS